MQVALMTMNVSAFSAASLLLGAGAPNMLPSTASGPLGSYSLRWPSVTPSASCSEFLKLRARGGAGWGGAGRQASKQVYQGCSHQGVSLECRGPAVLRARHVGCIVHL